MWTQQELADLLGTTQNTVSRWELGKTTPSPYFLKKLSAIFGKSPQEMDLLFYPMDEKQHAHAPTWLASSDTLDTARDRPMPLRPAVYACTFLRIEHNDYLKKMQENILPDGDRDATIIYRGPQPLQAQLMEGRDEISKTRLLAEHVYRAHEQGELPIPFGPLL